MSVQGLNMIVRIVLHKKQPLWGPLVSLIGDKWSSCFCQSYSFSWQSGRWGVLQKRRLNVSCSNCFGCGNLSGAAIFPSYLRAKRGVCARELSRSSCWNWTQCVCVGRLLPLSGRSSQVIAELCTSHSCCWKKVWDPLPLICIKVTYYWVLYFGLSSFQSTM